jgi:UMF1 family MFS transporter
VILLSPPLGAWADRRNLKAPQLAFWTLLGSAATAALFGATPGRLGYSLLFSFAAILSYELAQVFYNAFIKDVSTAENAGRVSGLGFALGYIGGGLCLGLNLLMIKRPALFGLGGTDDSLPIRASVLSVGVWWALFSIPAFLWLRDRPTNRSENVGGTSFGALKRTLASMWTSRPLRRYFVAYLLFNDGIQTILVTASIFGAQALGMSTAQLGGCYLLIQFVAFGGALVCGRLADRWSHKNVILVTLAVYSAVTIWAVWMKTPAEFWALGVIIGLVLGGSQSAARSLFSLMTPESRSTEYFALFSIVGKASSLMGPFVFGTVAQFFGLRAGVASLLIFFVAGGALLWTVDEKAGRAGALTPSA